MSLDLIRINGLLEETQCAQMWGDDSLTCCGTRHRCMYPVTSSTTTIDSVNVCGKPFCISCMGLHKLEGSKFCPSHHPSIKDTTTSMPLVLIPDADGKTNKVPINGKKVEETNEMKCRMIKTRECVIRKVAGGMREGVTGSTGLFYCSFSHDGPIHFECYKALVCTSYANKHLICKVDGKKVAMFVCGKRCYNVFKK